MRGTQLFLRSFASHCSRSSDRGNMSTAYQLVPASLSVEPSLKRSWSDQLNTRRLSQQEGSSNTSTLFFCCCYDLMLHLAGGQHKSTATSGTLKTLSWAQDRKSHHDYWFGKQNTRKRNHVGDQRFCQFAKGRSEVADRLQSHPVAQACEAPLIRGGKSATCGRLLRTFPF